MHLRWKPYSKQLGTARSKARGGQLRLHIWKIFLPVRCAGAGKGLPGEREATQGWRRRELAEARAIWYSRCCLQLCWGIRKLPTAFFLPGAQGCVWFPCKEGSAEGSGKERWWVLHSGGLLWSWLQLARISATPKTWIYASSTHKKYLSTCRKKARNGYFIQLL